MVDSIISNDVALLVQRWPLIKYFDLTQDSVALVIGAYTGLGMQALREVYAPKYVIGFEPQDWAVEAARERLAPYENCVLFDFALGVRDDELTMGEWHTDGCSFVNTGPNSRLKGTGRLRDVRETFQRLANRFKQDEGVPFSIDLIQMNIEAYEYILLPYMLDQGLLDNVRRLAVQFHRGLGYDDQAPELLAKLDAKMGSRLYDDFPTWVYWERQ